MLNRLKAPIKVHFLQVGVVIAALLAVQLGCGGSANKIEPPKNPTPLPDPESRIQVGGGKTSIPASSDRKLGR
jgi:hypothetical protein